MDNFRGCLKSRNMYNVPCVEREEEGKKKEMEDRESEVRGRWGTSIKARQKARKAFHKGDQFERLSNWLYD